MNQTLHCSGKEVCLDQTWRVKQTHEGYLGDRQTGNEAKKEATGDRGHNVMSVKKVIVNVEIHNDK